ncbi:MAG: PAS domain-containing sensor histidine kinase [Patescibacteria group bacterium]
MEHLFACLRNSIDGVAVINESGVVLFWNPALERLSQIKENEAKSQKIWNLQRQLALNKEPKNDTVSSWLFKAGGLSNDGTPNTWTETSFLRTDGSLIYVEYSFYSFYEQENFFCIIVRDITERKKTEKILKDVNSIMFHDLRSPLASIFSFSDPENFENLSPTDLKKFMEIIHEDAGHMVNMINSTLLLARLERGDRQFEKLPVSVLNLTERIRNQFSYLNGSAGIRLKIIFDHKKMIINNHSLEINVEESLFLSVVVNLITNAIEASTEGSKEVLLRISCDDKIISFSVHNFGEISSEVQPKLFQKYATFGKPKGNGLGLYSAKLIANAHGGDISFSSGNSETIFVVTIPQALQD